METWALACTLHVVLGSLERCRGTQAVFPSWGPEIGATVSQVQRTRWPEGRVAGREGTGEPYIPEGSGSCSAPTSALMKLWVGMLRRRGAHLKNANAIGKSGANWNNFLLAAK